MLRAELQAERDRNTQREAERERVDAEHAAERERVDTEHAAERERVNAEREVEREAYEAEKKRLRDDLAQLQMLKADIGNIGYGEVSNSLLIAVGTDPSFVASKK